MSHPFNLVRRVTVTDQNGDTIYQWRDDLQDVWDVAARHLPATRKEGAMRPEPILTRALITAAVTSVLTVLVVFGVPLTQGQQTAIVGLAVTVGPLVVGVVTWAWGRRKVTPLSDPRNNNGKKLI